MRSREASDGAGKLCDVFKGTLVFVQDPARGRRPHGIRSADLDVSILQERLLLRCLASQSQRRIPVLILSAASGASRSWCAAVRRTARWRSPCIRLRYRRIICSGGRRLLMPPKSTWFEPKLRSGLFIHALGKLTLEIRNGGTNDDRRPQRKIFQIRQRRLRR